MAFEVRDRASAWFTENFSLKLLSVGCALLLYSLVHSAQDAQRTVSASVVVELPRDTKDRVLVDQTPQVRLFLRGPTAALDEIRPDDLSLEVQLSSTNERVVKLDSKMVHLPSQVRIEAFDPASVELVWEEIITRDVPIQVNWAGTPAPGFVTKGAPEAEPKVVRAHGPKSEVENLQYARAAAFDVNGLTEGPYPRDLRLDPPPPRVSYEKNTVTVTAEIARELTSRQFPRRPVVVTGLVKSKTVPAEVDVSLTCPPENLRGLRDEQIQPRVEVKTTATSGSESAPVTLQIDKCEARIIPSTVVVKW
jgi:hypothetical protein